MKSLIKFLIILFLFSSTNFCQENQDSSRIKSENEKKLIIPVQSFKLFTNTFSFQSNLLGFNENYTTSNSFIPLSMAGDKNYLISLNRDDLLQQLTLNYQQSRPTTFQQIMGMVQVGAAVALAGYHLYKYEIKKEKK
ncbi:MAG: hypothetical protein NTX22_16640 [Ignavibacteriales bacterium]|nr:hypothetical protein [Ignavibacteriales bacterium]